MLAAFWGCSCLCLRGFSTFYGSHDIQEAHAGLAIIAVHKWKHQTLFSVTGVTICYVLVVQVVF